MAQVRKVLPLHAATAGIIRLQRGSRNWVVAASILFCVHVLFS